MPGTREIGARNDPLRVAIADDSGLIFSDDYRAGWKRGFEGIGCTVKVFDVSGIRKASSIQSPYSTMHRGFPKMIAQEIWKFRPDLVWCHHGRAASHEYFMQQLRDRGIPVAVYLCDEPYETGETARYSHVFSHVFTMDPCTIRVHQLSRTGRSNVYYLPPAVDTDLFPYNPYNGGAVERVVPSFFLGNAELTPRRRWLEPVERSIDGTVIAFWADRRGKTVGKGSKRWIPLDQVPRRYSSCVVGLNIHRDPRIDKGCFERRVLLRPKRLRIPDGIKLCPEKPEEFGTGFWNDANLPAAHINPRFFEMAACGTCVVSDAMRYELTRMFPMAPRAQTPEHFLELVHYYTRHPEEAEEIGSKCSSLISKRHTYKHRAAEVLIRLGLKESQEENLRICLGEPEDYLSPQDFGEQGIELSWGATGHSERWSPASGKSSTKESGSLKEGSSVDETPAWLL
jgi:hypothetical protein